MQCDFHENLFCYKCTRVSDKSSDALCKGVPDEGISWFCLHYRISFNGVYKLTNKISKIKNSKKDIIASIHEVKSKITNEPMGASKLEIEVMVREEFNE